MPPGGVIHDIGFRHYDGPRLGRGYIRRSLYGQSVRSTYGIGRTARAKVLPMLLLAIMVIPAIVIVPVMIVTEADEQPLAYEQYAFAFSFIVSIYVASQAPQLFSRDLRFRTISLYLSRPLTTGDYVSARFAALVTGLFILMGLPLVVLYAGGLLAELSFVDQTREFLAGLGGVVVFALVFAAVGALVAALTSRRGIAVAVIITLLVVSYTAVTTVQGIAEVEGEPRVGGWAGLFSPVTLADGVQVALFGADPASEAGPPDATAEAVFLVVAVVFVAASFALLLLRYRRLRA